MEASLSNNNFENLKLLAHKLKTSIDSLSIECLKSEVRFIEKFAGNYPEHESIDQRFNYINTILNVVIEDLSIYLSNK